MQSLPVIVQLNIFKYRLFSLLSIGVLIVMYSFFFERMEEALSDGIIMALAFTAHTANHRLL